MPPALNADGAMAVSALAMETCKKAFGEIEGKVGCKEIAGGL